MDFEKAKKVSLKNHSTFNEKWLQDRLAEDPGLLGLGDLEVRDTERRQPHAGRLDLLLSDVETGTRYEVEIQLGATNEAHIIRTVEYWDIEQTRYPQHEHVAVLVAEDITSRFLNVIALFNKAIPLIAIQMQALQVGEALTLNATTVLDLVPLGTEEEDEPGQATDRAYWINRGSQESVALVDELLALLNETTQDHLTLKYNKHHIGLARDGVTDNLVTFRAREHHVLTKFRIPRSEEVSTLIEESAIESFRYTKREGRYTLSLRHGDLEHHRDVLVKLMHLAGGDTGSDSEPPSEPTDLAHATDSG